MNKKIIWGIVIAVIIVFVIGTSYWLGTKNIEVGDSTIVNDSKHGSDQINWVSYTDPVSGVSFKYPANFYISKYSDRMTGRIDLQPELVDSITISNVDPSFLFSNGADKRFFKDGELGVTVKITRATSVGNYIVEVDEEIKNVSKELQEQAEIIVKSVTKPKTLSNVSTNSVGIQVISPKSGDKLIIGKTYDVKWSSYSGQENLNIVLVGKKSSTVITTAVRAIDVGTYKMTVPALDTNDTYKIEVYPAGGRELVGRSGEFTITN